MIKRTLFVACSFALISAPLFAGSVKSANLDITLSGGASAGYFFSNNTGSSNEDNFIVSDFIIELGSDEPKTGGVGFFGGYGNFAQVTLLDGNGDGADTDSTLRYAWMSWAPVENVTVEAGLLASNVGFEVANSYDNGNISLGALWNAQPAYYPGARVSYDMGDMSVYAEANNDGAAGGSKAFAVGLNGSASGVDYAINYFDGDGDASRNIIDLIVSTNMSGTDVGVNIDFHVLDDKPMGATDDSGFGIAVYAVPNLAPSIDLPVRLEYISDGDSGIYGFDSGFTLTVTPTMNVGKHGFVRAEVSYVTADNKMFTDKDGKAEDTKTSFAFQVGYKF